MDEPNLVSISLSAFMAVLVLLSFLALVIRGIAYLFQERSPAVAVLTTPEPSARAGDPALLAALHAAARQRFPDHRITTVEETTTGSGR